MKILKSILTVAIIATMASCGNGSGSGKKLAKNEVLGDMPNIVYQHFQTDSIIDADEEKAYKGIKSEKDFEKAIKLKAKFKERQEKEDAQFKANIEKIKAELVGKDIPYEVGNGIGYEITSCKVSNVERSNIYAEFELKVTDIKAANIIGGYYGGKTQIIVTAHSIDKDGNRIDSDGAYYIDLSEKANGATGKALCNISIRSKEAAQYVNFAKIKFINNK